MAEPHDSGSRAAPGEKIHVFLLDDHEVVRRGLRELLETEDDLEVVGEASTAEEALARIPPTQPNVAVLDVRLPDGNGVEVCREIRSNHPEIQCLILTSFADDEALFQSIMAGAAGYVLKQIRGGELVRAIREVGAGKSLLDPEVTRSVLERLRKGKTMRDEKLARLSAQEERILTLVAKGHTNGQIGKELKLAEKTVKNYVSTILSKLEVARRAEAAAYLARHTTTPGTTG
jgi:DNA-binding NarL/FixJ family response regulator